VSTQGYSWRRPSPSLLRLLYGELVDLDSLAIQKP